RLPRAGACRFPRHRRGRARALPSARRRRQCRGGRGGGLARRLRAARPGRLGKPAMSGDDDPWPPEPRANPRLLGQEEAEARLLAAEASGRLPHAWLLAGPRGIGKATLAFRFARYLLAGGAAGRGEAGGAGLFGEAPAPGLAMAP